MVPPSKKRRVDLILVELGLAPSREKAQRLILAGLVYRGDEAVQKAGQAFSDAELLERPLRVLQEEHPFVSRGGIKLQRALEAFKITVQNSVCLDIGASTGGFTQVLLLNGALRVHAVDVGHNQMDWKIRSDPRVRVYEKLNARSLKERDIGELVDFTCVDVSFISLEKILPALLPLARPAASWVTLIKPQFEVGKGKVGAGGIVRSEEDRLAVVSRIQDFCKTLGLKLSDLIESPITGSQGNREYLAHWRLDDTHGSRSASV